MKLRHERLLDCRYYNGEDIMPAETNSMFWHYECGWVNGLHENWEAEKKEISYFGLNQWLEEEDGTQPDFKCLLFNRYCHWFGMDGGTEEFIKWYRESYVLPRQTNRQRRYSQRKEKLLKKCRFYNGEEDCPYKDENDCHFWKYEKIWVDRLSRSYTHADEWREELLPFGKIQDFVEEYDLPSSYIGLLINRELHWIGMIYEQSFISFIKRHYLKIKE